MNRARTKSDLVGPIGSPDLAWLPVDPATRRHALGFLRLAVTALLWSGLFVLLVSVGRTPLVEFIAGKSYLYTALVAHVVFALVAWLLSGSAVLWLVGAARLGRPLPDWPLVVAQALAWLGTALLVAVPLLGLGEPVMADYVPVLMHPLFLVGLVAYLSGIAVVAVLFLWRLPWRNVTLETLPLALGAAAFLSAGLAFGLAWLRWGGEEYATLVWGSGHLFQTAFATSLVSFWLTLVPVRHPLVRSLVLASQVGFVLAPVLVLVAQVAPVTWSLVSGSFWSSLGVPLCATWLAVVLTLGQDWWRQLRRPGLGAYLPFTLVLFPIGGLIALPGLGYDTRLTAHYHATVGAVTMGFMALGYALANALGRPLAWPRLARWQPRLYGYGLLCLVGGLYFAGEAGTTRKIFEAMATKPALWPAAGLFILGALLTLAGGVSFVAGLGWTLLGDVPTRQPHRAPTAEAVATRVGD